jgi:formylglycine-generating enzyme required for sulfatase activity
MPPRTFGPLSTARYTANGVAFDTIRVPPGRFVDGKRMGRRALLVSRPFEIGVTLVTQALWRAVTGESPSEFPGPDRPVEQVSWDDVQAFLGQLEVLGLDGFCLPTEAEWAWAAQCGVATLWAGANRPRLVVAANRSGTKPVGSLPSSAAGALDFSGNLQEWQENAWSHPLDAGVDTQGPAWGPMRAFRSNGWLREPQLAQVTVRSGYDPYRRSDVLGVRLLRTTP